MSSNVILRHRTAAVALLAGVLGSGAPARALASATEPAITAPGPEGDYLRALHTLIHFRWANQFIAGIADKRPASDPVNDPKLETEVLFAVRWDGSPAEVTLWKSSKVLEFDQAAMAAVKGKMPYPVPPIEVYGDDGVAHFRWVFARDHRLCSGGELRRVEAPLADALPRLFVQGRTKEALLRVARYTRDGDRTAFGTFARAWLARPQADPAVDARAAAALARGGDPQQIERLKPALGRADTAPMAASVLAGIGIDVCALVKVHLRASDPAGAEIAAIGLRAAGQSGAAGCAPELTALVKSDGLPGAFRANMLRTLSIVSPTGNRKLALAALGDTDPQLRAAGVEVFARPGGGRPTLYRLQPLLQDPSVEVRGAVAAGLIRSCGDLANDYVLPLFKAPSPEPLAAMAPELGRQTSPASLDLLAKMQKRNDPRLRVPVLAGLAMRTDSAGRAMFQSAAAQVRKDPYAPAEARRIVFASADSADLPIKTADPALGLLTFKALLRAQRHTDAMDWLVASFDRLPPETLVDAFSAWLANPPIHTAAK
jgi:HEAT repeat protein